MLQSQNTEDKWKRHPYQDNESQENKSSADIEKRDVDKQSYKIVNQGMA